MSALPYMPTSKSHHQRTSAPLAHPAPMPKTVHQHTDHVNVYLMRDSNRDHLQTLQQALAKTTENYGSSHWKTPFSGRQLAFLAIKVVVDSSSRVPDGTLARYRKWLDFAVNGNYKPIATELQRLDRNKNSNTTLAGTNTSLGQWCSDMINQ